MVKEAKNVKNLLTYWRPALIAAAIALALTGCGGAKEDGNQGAQGGQPEQEQGQQQDGQAQQPSSGEYDVAKAEALYKQSCAACHGANLEGAVGPDLQTVGSRLSKDDILNILQNGRGQMPGGLVKGEDAETLAAWLADKK